MPDCGGAPVRRLFQVRAKPLRLGRGIRAADEGAVRVERDDMPAPGVKGVVATSLGAGRLPEEVEVAACTGCAVLVVSRRWAPAILERGERRPERVPKLIELAV